jgi:archaellum component FlaG (FlaF/FlaG flagellin family)
MKRIILSVMIAFGGLMTASAQTPDVQPGAPVDPKAAEVKFEKETHDFGSIPQGTPATYEFVFKNTGKSPLIITNAAASCGCTTPDWTREPIKPGKTGTVKATYNAASPGPFTKSVTVISNAKNSTVILYLKGDVKPSEAK